MTMQEEFWKLRPKAPDEDWIAPLLRISLGVSTVGWIIYGVFALAFDDIAVISEVLQSWLVILGSMLIVAGAEMNTAPTVVAVSRKWGAQKGQPLDAIAFTVSLVGSIVGGLIALSIRQTRLGDGGWRALTLGWGPLVVGIAIALDFYAAATELGLLKADYEQAMETWREEKRAFDEVNGNIRLRTEPQVTELEFDPAWPVAAIDDFRGLISQMNGSRSTLTEDKLRELLHKNKKRPPSPSTMKRWLKIARD